MSKNYSIEEIATEFSYKKYYNEIPFVNIMEAIKNAKKDLGYLYIYDYNDIDIIDEYIKENYILSKASFKTA